MLLWRAGEALWGADGLAPRSGELHRTVFATSYGVRAVLIAQLACGLALLLRPGRVGRAVPACAALALWILHSRLPDICDAGDYVARHLLCMACLFSCPTKNRLAPLETTIHNCGVALVVAQAAAIYFSAGIAKWATAEWHSGRALVLLAENPRFDIAALSPLLVAAPWLAKLLTNALMFHQIAWPFLLPTRWRRASLLASASFHLATAWLMGLATFSVAMLSLDAFLLELTPRVNGVSES